MPRTLIALAALAVLAPHALAQSYINFGTQCTAGSLRACSSTEVWNEFDPETGAIYLMVRLANVQGTAGFGDLGPSALMDWSISNLALETYDVPAVPRTGWMTGGGGETFGRLSGNAAWCEMLWHLETPPNCYTAGIGDPARLRDDGDGWSVHEPIWAGGLWAGLWGCDIAWGDPTLPGELIEYGAATTCGGHVTWRLRPRMTLDPYGAVQFGGLRLTEQSAITYRYHGPLTEGGEFVSCTTGVDCITVVPEPMTLALFGSGLLGIAGIAYRRRRKADLTEDELERLLAGEL